MNYKIEDNIDFLIEFKKQLQERENIKVNTDIDDDNICLISNSKLEDNYIVLGCGHKFNYKPLYTELCNQKTHSNLEVTSLLVNELKCPYCRVITPKILPYISTYNLPLKRGVNSPNKYCMRINDCTWIYKGGNKRGNKCCKPAYKDGTNIFCTYHHKVAHVQCLKSNVEDETIIPWTTKHEQLFKKYLVKELKQLLKDKDCIISGKKKTLVYRVINNNIL